MRTPAGVALFVMISAGCPRNAQPDLAARAAAQSIERLEWIAGCWERAGVRQVAEEQWTRPRGGTMLGMARTVRGDRTVAWEHLRIAETAGALSYHAMPSGQPPAVFTATILTDSAVTFENATHDFPQRVMYRRAGRDSLHARIEGTVGGRSRAVDFRFHRSPCAS